MFERYSRCILTGLMKALAIAITLLACIVLSWLVVPEAHAQTSDHPEPPAFKKPYIVPQLEGTIQLDGRSNEAAWQTVKPLPMMMYMPVWGETPTERTEIRLIYDEEYLYVSGRFFYSDPAQIQATTRIRDNASTVNDMFFIILDTFNDNESALLFITTPAGTRSDIALAHNMEGAFSAFWKPSWNTFWKTVSARDERGWFVEVRIPFSSLRFQERNGQVKMGLIVKRWIANKQEAIIYPAVSNQFGYWGQFKPSEARTIVFEDIKSHRPFYVTPYVLGSLHQFHTLNNNQTTYDRHDDPSFDAGLDIKYGLSNNFTLDLTLNTDFAQVEADNQQINLTRFSLFFPEKRRFFLERAGLFSFGANANHRLFYSRRIGLFEGRPIRILGGARLVGRKGPWDIGLLNMQTARTGISIGNTLPSENFGVIRLRRSIFNSNSYLGAMATSRVGLDGSYNLAYGADGNIRVAGHEYLQFNWAQTFDSNLPGGLDAARMHLSWERRTLTGLGYDAAFTRSGPFYSPGTGFELRNNYSLFHGQFSYGTVAPSQSPLLRGTYYLKGNVFLSNDSGKIESVRIEPSVYYIFKSELGIKLKAIMRYENLTENFFLSPNVHVPADDYSFYLLQATYDMIDSQLLDIDMQVKGGTFFDGNLLSVLIKPVWSISAGLKLNGAYQINRIRFPIRNQHLNTHLGRLRIRVMPSTQLSISSFVQYSSAADLVAVNARLHYTPREGNDFYLVFNQGLNTNRYQLTPALPVSNSLAIIVKYNYTFSF